ncbi:murein transglycosylase A [Thaumasiovibrio sp. DFM-14]|uniref:murein transglycosylase A n=1 Tax=Thaumasiovibrio sp. DFM-14 TaxID=3384792 RepID=UPI0039A1C689
MVRFIKVCVLGALLTGCAKNVEQGQQYLDGQFEEMLNPVTEINTALSLKETEAFLAQSELVLSRSPSMAKQYAELYEMVNAWLTTGGHIDALPYVNLDLKQLGGSDGYGNVLMTGYFSPVIELRHQPDSTYQYPLYANPQCGDNCPSRAEIYWGALDGQGLELGYSADPLANFMMEVQGSGFVHFGDDDQLQYFAYSGKNNHPYSSIGRVLIERGEVPAEQMSLEAITLWASQQDEASVFELMEQNASYVFFKANDALDVIGSAGIPLLAEASVAADRDYIPMGSVLLVEVPLLTETGLWTGEHELRLVVALDTGGAVKRNHLDLYHGMGSDAGRKAGHYKHFGRVWTLGLAQ